MKTIISWFSVPATDLKRAVKFYETIFDMKLSMMKDNMWDEMAMFKDDKGDMPWAITVWEGSIPSKDWVTLFFNTDGKLDEVLSKVEWAWWKIKTKRMSIGEWWYMATIMDTEWNTIWLHSM